MGSPEPTKLLYHFQCDQVYDFWLIQPKIILIQAVSGAVNGRARERIAG
ncbi:MAG: hypothetical protein ABJM26_07535 [Anderseniella sp.]